LDREPAHEFFFVSSVGAEVFQSICNFARGSDNNPVLFYQEKIFKRSQNVKKCFKKFCTNLSLNSAEETERTKAFQYLKRTFITVYLDDQGT
jgi:hypothetical protein